MTNVDATLDLTAARTVTRTFVTIDLRRHFNNDGISFDAAKGDGDFDGKGGAFPGEELPGSNSLISLDGIPFFFPSKEDGHLNNMALAGQSIGFEPALLKAVHVIGAVEGQNGEVYEEEITVSLENGTFHPLYLGLSNWLLPARYNEKVAFQCSHLHFPDAGQESSPGRDAVAMSPYDEALVEYHSLPGSDSIDKENAAKAIWRPRLWLQRVPAPFDEPVVGLTFLDNLNFHIFALTLETRI